MYLEKMLHHNRAYVNYLVFLLFDISWMRY